jgi:small nuclear ribonucleoprotein (snRNP)-like protein
MKHLIEYMYQVVEIETHDGRILKGPVVSYDNAIENDLEYDEISIDYKTHHEVIDESEIKTIKVLEE